MRKLSQITLGVDLGNLDCEAFEFFSDPKKIEISKNHSNIICTSKKVVLILKIRSVWLKNLACHANFNFELKMGVAGSIFKPQPCNFEKNVSFIDVQMMLVSFFKNSNHLGVNWEKRFYFSFLGPMLVVFGPMLGKMTNVGWKWETKSVFLNLLQNGLSSQKMILEYSLA